LFPINQNIKALLLTDALTTSKPVGHPDHLQRQQQQQQQQQQQTLV